MRPDMTREEAISLLRRYKRDVYGCDRKLFDFRGEKTRFKISVYGRFLCDRLICEIRNSKDGPIEVVHDYYSMFDDVLCESDDDHFGTHNFARILEYEAGQILRYLRKEEENDSIGS